MNLSPFPAISANTLFHFTGSLENLIGILTNEFRPHYCLEDFNLLLTDRPHQDSFEWAVPMVSFCDIPLSNTGFHLSVYGDYGIGMTKSWGRHNGISPVLYAYPGSSVTSIFKSIVGQTDASRNEALGNYLNDFVSFIKPYEGDLWREGGMLSNIRFYDEREWRFVPRLPSDFDRPGLQKVDFLNDDRRRTANSKIAEISRIAFVPNDIKYLIVRREDEIVPLIREVERIKGKYSHDEVRLVTSRVISAEQIRSDF